MLSSAALCQQAVQIARVTSGMISQAGQFLNSVLDDLPREYDLALAINTVTINLTGGAGVGPYSLPMNYLRACSKDLTYMIAGMPFRLIQITLAEFDMLINTIGVANYPNQYATDVSPLALNPPANPKLFVYPPPVSVIPLQIRYYGSFPEITTPETSTQIPWFPGQAYLKTRVAGELMSISGDPRADAYLGDGPQGAVGILRRWLNLQRDNLDMGAQVLLDPRVFGPGGAAWPPSKLTGGV